MPDYNLAQYYDDAFGIDAADQVVAAQIDLETVDSSIDIDLEESYH